MKRAACILGFFIVTGFVSLSAMDNFILEVGSGASWIHNEAYGVLGPGDKDPDPIIYRFNLTFPLYFSESFFFSPGLALSANPWQYVEDQGWAMPVDKMWQDLYVMSLNLDLPVGFQLNFRSFSAALYAGPNLNFRIPLWGEGESVRSDMITYFFSEARFLNIMGGLLFVVPMSDLISFTFRAESYVPIHNIWSSGGLPFSDGLTVSVIAGVRFNFPL